MKMHELVIDAPNAIQFRKNEIVVDFSSARPEAVLAELMMVRYEPLKIRGSKARPYIVLCVGHSIPASRVAVKKASATFTLTTDDLFGWTNMCVFLYRQNGDHEDSHIHIECVPPKSPTASFDLTPTFKSKRQQAPKLRLVKAR